jgi:conjugative transposon TraM protein
MKNEQQSQAFLRKRKMMMLMPLMVLPFITLAFWALGGGQENKVNGTSITKAGLNLNLPDAKLKEDGLIDKLGFYDKADKDSSQIAEWMRNDPYYQLQSDSQKYFHSDIEQMAKEAAGKYNQQLSLSPYEYSNNNPEQKIMEKLKLLEKEINKQSADTNIAGENYLQNGTDSEMNDDAGYFHNMMQQMNQPSNEDPEITQLNQTLDKILDIQHPQRLKDKLNENELKRKETVYAVTNKKPGIAVSHLDTAKTGQNASIGFYGIEKPITLKEENSIEAAVHETQTLTNGSIIKLRLLNDIFIDGAIISKGNFVFGFVSLTDERLSVEITSIRCRQSIFPVNLTVFDMDGLAGIYIPGAITRDVAKQSADNSLQLMELSTMDPSFKAQAAAAGVNAAKSLLSRKVKLVKVIVKTGYKVLLKDKNVQQ